MNINTENSYLVIDRNDNVTEYMEKMLFNSKISTLLGMDIRHLNGKAFYYYDTKGKPSLNTIAEKSLIGKELLIGLLKGIDRLFSDLENYLFQPDLIIFDPQYIFFDMESNEPFFCLYPSYEEGIGVQLKNLTEYLLDHIDNSDEEICRLAYGYFELVSEETYSPASLLKNQVNDNYKESAAIVEPSREKEEPEGYYFTEQVVVEDVKEKKLLLPICLSIGPIALISVLYISFYLNIELLEYLGILQETYIATGVVIILIMSLVIFVILKTIEAKNKNQEIDPILC